MVLKTKILILALVLAALPLIGCAVQSATLISEQTTDAATPEANEEEHVLITLPPSPTPVPPTLTLEAAPTEEPTPTAEPTEEPTPTPDYELTNVKDVDGYVGAVSVNLRAGPGTDYRVIGEYECNTALTITAKTEEWYQVELDGKTGFMFKEYIGVGAIPTPTPKSTPKATKKPGATASATPKATQTPAPVEATNGGAGGYSAEEVLLTAQLAYEESKRGDYDGYRAVANVILNRVASGVFRSSVTSVIFQGNGAQFSPARDEAELRSVKPSQTCIDAVQAVFNGDTFLPTDVYYFRAASKGTSWSSHNYYGTYGGNAYFS